VIDLDIQRFFDTVDWGHLRDFLDQRVRDGVIRRAIGKWLHAGVMEAGAIRYPDEGTPQGGVVSPILANVFLHEVLDTWFYEVVQPRLKGRAVLVRYADDAVMAFERKEDADRVMAVLAKRFAKYGLTLHPEKTRMVDFRRPGGGSLPGSGRSFDCLGFTHYWGRSRKGRWIVKRKTASMRMSRALRRIGVWCRTHRHWRISDQQRALSRKLQGHDSYYGITGNGRAVSSFHHETKRLWRKWLSRRSYSTNLNWARFARLLSYYPLPPPRVVHSIYRRATST
jgi:group II intron reverse transcriptase/maturase